MIIDTTDDVSKRLTILHNAGVRTIIRYLALGTSWKTITVEEAHAIAGMNGLVKLGLVFEVDGKPHGSVMGKRDGHAAFMGAKKVGAPENSILWYTIDYDIGPSDMLQAIYAFMAFKNEVGPYYRVGAYCSGYAATKLLDANAVDKNCIWITQSMGFRGTRDFLKTDTRWKMVQKLPSSLDRFEVDVDTLNTANGEIEVGDFIPGV